MQFDMHIADCLKVPIILYIVEKKYHLSYCYRAARLEC